MVPSVHNMIEKQIMRIVYLGESTRTNLVFAERRKVLLIDRAGYEGKGF